MFGHDDHHSHDDNNNDNAVVAGPQHTEPTPDGSLMHDGAMPTGAPAPVVSDTDAGNFMADDTATVVAAPPAPASDVVPAMPQPVAPVSDDLMEIKQQALQQLSPLVGHLDQTPEEKFRTTMMMIQAADNQALIKDAYTAAQQIPDEKARAQALLDIVNEINYFTQHATDAAEAA